MEHRFQLSLDQIPDDVLENLFTVYTGRPEKPWLSKAWGILASKGLTSYVSAMEYNAVLGRLAVLAYIYRSWAEYAYGDDCDVEHQAFGWQELLPFRPCLNSPPSKADTKDNRNDSADDLLSYLMSREHPAVFDTLIESYGDDGQCGLASDLRSACDKLDYYSKWHEPYQEWDYGEKLFEETGFTPSEMDTIVGPLSDRFYLGC